MTVRHVVVDERPEPAKEVLPPAETVTESNREEKR